MATKQKAKSDYLSHTQIEVGKCPHRYNEFYNNGLYKDRESTPLRVGKFKHEFVRNYVEHCVKSEQDSDPDTMKKIFDDTWKKHYIDEELYQELFNECLAFAEKNMSWQNVLHTEKHFRVEFDSGKFFEGYIDINRIYKFRGIAKKDNDDILHTFDYKNQQNILKVEESLTPQLKLYTFANYHTLPKFKYYRRGIYYLKYNFIRCFEEEDNPTSLADIEIEVQETKEMLLREWNKLKTAKEFPAVPGKHCYQYEGCPVLLAGKCPKIKKKDFTAIDEKVRKIFQMNVQLKQLKKEAKDYITENGNVTVDEKEVGWLPEDKTSYPFEPGYNVAKEVGYDFIAENFSSTIMKKVIKLAETKLNSKDLLKAIEGVSLTTTDTKFKGLKS